MEHHACDVITACNELMLLHFDGMQCEMSVSDSYFLIWL